MVDSDSDDNNNKNLEEKTDQPTNQDDMIVYFTSKYNRKVLDDGIEIVNDTFTIHHSLGEGSFWQAWKVKRHYYKEDFKDNNWYIFKEGLLSIKDDDIVYSLMSMGFDEKKKLSKEDNEVRLGVRRVNILCL